MGNTNGLAFLSMWQLYNLFYFVLYYTYVYKNNHRISMKWVCSIAAVNIFIALLYMIVVGG